MKLLIVAGGGGHFAPALAVIEALPKNVDVLVIGRKYTFEGETTESLEYQTAKKQGIRFETITTGRLQRKLTRHSLGSVLKVPIGYFQSLKILKQYKPDVVLSFGGYVSLPVAFAAKTFGIPIVVHEQILSAGMSNKIVATIAEKVCISWEQSRAFFPSEKVVLTGNPIRKEQEVEGKELQFETKRPIVYVTGGSGGAHAVNILIEECLEKLLKHYNVIHQTGDAKEFGDFDRLINKKKRLPDLLQKRYVLTKFVESHQVFALLERADLVVSRSGINTMTEILSLGKPCLLIPLPYGQHNEQLTNALFVKQVGIAEVAKQKELTGSGLYDLMSMMMTNIDRYKKNGLAAKKLLLNDSAQKIVALVQNVNKQAKITKS